MTQGSIWKLMVRFAIPIFLGNLFQQFYNVADTFIVGNVLGTEAMAAVGSSGNLICHLVYSLHCYFDRNQFYHSTFRQLVNVFSEKVAQHEKIANVKFRLQGCHERQIMV